MVYIDFLLPWENHFSAYIDPASSWAYHEQVVQLLLQGLVSEGNPNVGHVGVGDIVAGWTLAHVLRPQPPLFLLYIQIYENVVLITTNIA